MPGSDFTALNTAITALTAQATNTETVEASATVVLQGFAAQIQTAVTAGFAWKNSFDACTLLGPACIGLVGGSHHSLV